VGDGARAERDLAQVLVHPAEAAGEPVLRAALERLRGVAWLGLATKELRAALGRKPPAALVLDVSLAGHDALDSLREARARGVTTPALVIAELGDAEVAPRAEELGGCRVLARQSLSPALLDAALAELLGLEPVTAPAPDRPSARHAPAMLWRSDARGGLTHATRRLLEYLALEESAALGHGWVEAVHPGDRGEWFAAWADWLDSPREDTLDLRLQTRSGPRRVRVTATPGFDPSGALECFVGSIFEIEEWAGALDAARFEATRHESTIRELEELAFAGAHDLQEPLRSVESEIDDLLRGKPGDLELALRQLNRMRTLLRDLVEFAMTTQVRVTAEPSDLAQALEWALENLRAALGESSAQVKVEALVRVHADPIQVARVFQNLLANAVRFRSPAAPVISVGASARERDALVFVRDNGLGIAPAHHESIFRVFERAHPDVRDGSGMGLAICRRIVERHGGRIWVESEPGQGATFYFTLPRAD